MKRIILFFFSLMITTLCFAMDPAEGYWVSVDEKTGKDTAGWQIWQENGTLYGKILSVAETSQDSFATEAKGKSYNNFYGGKDIATLKIVNTVWIWDLKFESEGKWANGYIIDPDGGKRYKCRITFHKADGKKYKTDTLEMRGEVGPFGRSQFWKKATQEEASSLK